MNNCTFISNVGRDAEVRFLPNGKPVTQFSIAVTSGYGEKQITSWVNCSMFGDRGEKIAQYITKGTKVGVTGEITLRAYKAKDGAEKSSLELRVNDLTLLGGKPESGTQSDSDKSSGNSSANDSSNFDNFDDDIPF